MGRTVIRLRDFPLENELLGAKQFALYIYFVDDNPAMKVVEVNRCISD